MASRALCLPLLHPSLLRVAFFGHFDDLLQLALFRGCQFSPFRSQVHANFQFLFLGAAPSRQHSHRLALFRSLSTMTEDVGGASRVQAVREDPLTRLDGLAV